MRGSRGSSKYNMLVIVVGFLGISWLQYMLVIDICVSMHLVIKE